MEEEEEEDEEEEEEEKEEEEEEEELRPLASLSNAAPRFVRTRFSNSRPRTTSG